MQAQIPDRRCSSCVWNTILFVIRYILYTALLVVALGNAKDGIVSHLGLSSVQYQLQSRL